MTAAAPPSDGDGAVAPPSMNVAPAAVTSTPAASNGPATTTLASGRSAASPDTTASPAASVEASAATHRRLQRPRRLALPRWLLLGWSAWLLVSWYLSFGQYRAVAVDSDAHVAAVRQMLVAISLWLAVAWPLFRFVGRPIRAPRLTCFVDFLAIVGTFQVVVWPMRLLTPWPIATVMLVDFMIIAWALVMSGIITWALITARGGRGRLAWTAVCLFILLVGPLTTWFALAHNPGLVTAEHEPLYWSPVSCMWLLASRTDSLVGSAEWARLGLLGAVGALLWLGAVLWPRTAIPRPVEPRRSRGRAAAPAASAGAKG